MINCRTCNPSVIACPKHVPMWIMQMFKKKPVKVSEKLWRQSRRSHQLAREEKP